MDSSKRKGKEEDLYSVILVHTHTLKVLRHGSHSFTCKQLALLRWQKFATRSVAVFCLTHHRGVDAGGGGECRAVCTVLLLLLLLLLLL